MVRLDVLSTEFVAAHGRNVEQRTDQYWKAFTCGWGPERHARILLVELLTTPPRFLPDLIDHPEFPEAARPTAAKLVAIYRDDIGPVDDPEVDAVWLGFWVPYPERARKLTAEHIGLGLRACRRKAGKRDGLGSKWDVLSSLCERIGAPMAAESLKTDWKNWREEKGEVVDLSDLVDGRDSL